MSQAILPFAPARGMRRGEGAAQRDSLGVFWGEFLVSPVPAEASFNRCDWGCVYCFPNLNVPHRKTGIREMMKLLATYHERDTLAAWLLRERYPVCISNRVDPLASNNVGQALPVISILTRLGIPVQIQTKGGRERDVDELLDILPPTVFYVSIAMLDDDLRRRIEPGAPGITDRLKLLKRLSRRGHRLVVGVNPLVPEWLPQPGELISRLGDLGVEGIWVERLHLNHIQVGNMSGRERRAVGETLIKRAALRKPAAVEWAAQQAARGAAERLSLSYFSMGQPVASDFFAPYQALYPRTFPIMQDFINACYQGRYQGRLISFADFWAYFGPHLPDGEFALAHYIGTVAHSAMRGDDRMPAKMSFKDLLRRIWRDRRINQCPARLLCFAWAGRWDGDGWIELVDDEGLPYLVFSAAGFDDYYTDVDF